MQECVCSESALVLKKGHYTREMIFLLLQYLSNTGCLDFVYILYVMYRHENLFEFHPPQGSSICFPRLKTGQNIEEFCDLLVKESGVLLLPATMYDTSDFAERGHFRLGLGRKIFAQGLEQLDKFLTNSRIFETSQ